MKQEDERFLQALAATDQWGGAVRAYADALGSFHQALISKGMSREESTELTKAFLAGLLEDLRFERVLRANGGAQ